MPRLKAVLGCITLLLACTVLSLAQTGSIEGTVTDSAGAVVPGAEITVRNLASNALRTVTAGGLGSFSVTDLPVSTYEIMVTEAGFKTFRVLGIQLTVAQSLTVNAQLEPGAVSEQIEVRGDQIPVIDLATAQISNLVDEKQILDLPLITRNPYTLALLSPGTSQTNTQIGGMTVNGSRERNNNFLLDGVDNNDTAVPGRMGGVLNANPDAAQEFRVITNNFNAEFGRNTGAIVDVVTASGTNAFHGDAYEFGRWNGLGGARDWFNPASQGPMNPYVRNQFGYSVGGPIRKNKTFFFFNQEFDRFVTALTNASTVPTAAFKTGVFTYTDPNGNRVPVDLTPGPAGNTQGQNNNNLPLDPTMQKILALYPNPTVSNGDGFSGTLFFPSNSREASYQTVAKIDHQINDHHTLNLRYGYDHGVDPDPFHNDALPGGVGATSEKFITDGLAATLTSNFRSSLVNSLNFGWNHLYANLHCTGLNTLDSVSQQDGTLDRFGNGRDYIMSPFTSFGCGLDSDSQFRKTGTVSYGDGLSWVHGAHTFKFGFDFRDVGESGPNNFFSRRQVYLDPASRFFTTLYSPVTVAGATAQLGDAAAALYGLAVEDLNAEFFNKAAVRQPTDNKFFRAHEYDGYAQDTWRVRPNLTLTLGLRYQFDGVPYEQNANFSNLLTDPASFPVVFSTVGPGTGKQIYQNDYTEFEPRVGFSWDPWKNGKTAIRGGFGIFHDRVFGNLVENARGSPPFQQDYHQFPFDTLNGALTARGGSYNGMPGFVGPFPGVPSDTVPSATVADGSQLAPTVIDTHLRPSASNNWSFGIQRELPGKTTMDLSYVGSSASHIYRDVDGNPPNPALVNSLVAFCSDPNNIYGCTPDEVSGSTLYNGGDFGFLPYNAVAHNALSQLDYFRSVGVSSYNGLQLKVTHPFAHGLELQGSYTWSHALDDSSDPLVPAMGNHTYPRNSLNLLQDWGNSDNDIRHVAVISYIWQLPVGRGQNYLNGGAVGKVLEGIQLTGITSLQTGHPFEVVSNTDSQRTGIASWAEQVGNPYAPSSTTPSFGKAYFTNPNAFTEPNFGGPSNVSRNQFYGPGLVDFDLSLAKTIKFSERLQLETRFESYNLFNHPHFENPGNQLGSSDFAVITSTASQPDGTTSARQIQVAVKLHF
jgi:Carboxypeptidase regulatory-like domain/TonB dependent receptor